MMILTRHRRKQSLCHLYRRTLYAAKPVVDCKLCPEKELDGIEIKALLIGGFTTHKKKLK